MKVIIDRFEEDFAVVEMGQEHLHVPRALFDGAQEGDTVEITVLGKPEPAAPDDDPRALFARLRRKRRRA